MPTRVSPVDGQSHDRLAGDDASLSLPNTISVPIDDGPSDEITELTTGQKMLSATSGSLLTGLLVTPLDVVRIRLQAQGISQPSRPSRPPPILTELQKLAVSTPNAFRPTNLGVTACCREVFFMNNNSEVCIAGPRVAAFGPGITTTTASSAVAECAVEQTQKRTFNSTFDGLRKIARNEGFFTLWRGLSPTLLMAIPGNIIYFTGYEWLRAAPQSPITRHVRDEYAPLAAGATSRTVAAIAIGPIELFRTRLQASQGESAAGHLKDTFRSIADMVGSHGYRSLWRGLTLTLWRDVPFSGMYWWGYEAIRGRLTDIRESARGRSATVTPGLDDRRSRGRARRRSQSRENHRDTFVDSFVAGAASGAFASIATMPFDVGKTRTQVYRDAGAPVADKSASAVAAAAEERSMVRLLWHIFNTEGAAGLFRGWIPRTLKVAPACAIMISSYEVGKRMFRGANERTARRETKMKQQQQQQLDERQEVR